MAHTFNPSTWEAEAGRFLSLRPVWSTELQSEFQDSQGYTAKPCLENPKRERERERGRERERERGEREVNGKLVTFMSIF